MKLEEGGWGRMSVEERSSFLMSLILTLDFFGAIIIIIGMVSEKKLAPLVNSYPILQWVPSLIVLVGGIMLALGMLIMIWGDTLSHWDGFE